MGEAETGVEPFAECGQEHGGPCEPKRLILPTRGRLAFDRWCWAPAERGFALADGWVRPPSRDQPRAGGGHGRGRTVRRPTKLGGVRSHQAACGVVTLVLRAGSCGWRMSGSCALDPCQSTGGSGASGGAEAQAHPQPTDERRSVEWGDATEAEDEPRLRQATHERETSLLKAVSVVFEGASRAHVSGSGPPWSRTPRHHRMPVSCPSCHQALRVKCLFVGKS